MGRLSISDLPKSGWLAQCQCAVSQWPGGCYSVELCYGRKQLDSLGRFLYLLATVEIAVEIATDAWWPGERAWVAGMAWNYQAVGEGGKWGELLNLGLGALSACT